MSKLSISLYLSLSLPHSLSHSLFLPPSLSCPPSLPPSVSLPPHSLCLSPSSLPLSLSCPPYLPLSLSCPPYLPLSLSCPPSPLSLPLPPCLPVALLSCIKFCYPRSPFPPFSPSRGEEILSRVKPKASGDTGSENRNRTEAFGLTFFCHRRCRFGFRLYGTVLENLTRVWF